MTEEEIQKSIVKFKKYLKKEGMSENTIISYTWTISNYFSRYDEISLKNLLEYKEYLTGKNALPTVCQRCIAINKYLSFVRRPGLKLRIPQIGQKQFLDNVISNEDYRYLKRYLKKEEKWKYYFIIWFIAATGARVSELIQFRVEHVVNGHMDLYGKGKKHRRIYIPCKLQKEALQWLSSEGRDTGYVFLNKYNEQISARGIERQMKKYGKRIGIAEEVLHPHSLRHLYAKNWVAKNKDYTLLADLLGHTSLETLRIYTKMSSQEQKNVINKVVTW